MDSLKPLETLPFAPGEFAYLLPIAIPAIFGMVAIILDLYLGRGRRGPSRNKAALAVLNALGCALAAGAALVLWKGGQDQVVLGGALAVSAFGAGIALAILLGTALIGFSVAHHGGEQGGALAQSTLAHGEFYGLMLFGTSGLMALAVANDLVTFFVAIETLSLAAYALTGADRRRARSAEGAMKYFVLGAFSAGFLLYGMALIYGATHTLRLDVMARTTVPGNLLPLATTGGMLLFIGLLFKVGAVPFHAWTPDAYEGAPSPATGWMSVTVKAAAFAGALRVTVGLGACGALTSSAMWVLWIVAGVTLIVGNAGALTQRNPRRLFAYSGIAHSGYLLIALLAVARYFDAKNAVAQDALQLAAQDAVAGLGFYLLAYAAANLGAFAVLSHLERQGSDVDSVYDLQGLFHSQPKAALVMTLSVLSLAGIPGTAGFLGKLWVFRAGIAAGEVGLVVLALIVSAISLFYYLNIVVVMFMKEPHAGTAGALEDDPQRWCSRLALVLAGLLTLWLGIMPLWPLDTITLFVNGGQALW